VRGIGVLGIGYGAPSKRDRFAKRFNSSTCSSKFRGNSSGTHTQRQVNLVDGHIVHDAASFSTQASRRAERVHVVLIEILQAALACAAHWDIWRDRTSYKSSYNDALAGATRKW
jgi:hypothetical protein